MESNYDLLIGKLNRFIRKYYKNQILRGFLIGFSILLSYFLVLSFSEYKAYFSVTVRTLLVTVGLALFFAVLVFLILIPFLKLIRLGDTISHKQAAQLISRYFSHLNDQLLNTIELAEKANLSDEKTDLLIASINQRIETLRPIPFRQAINLKENLKYLKFALPVLFIAIGIYLFQPVVFTSSAERLVHFRQEFEVPAPFSFLLVNDSLEVEKGKNFVLKLDLEGEYIPSEVYCCYGGSRFLMNREKGNRFSYTFRNLNNSLSFFFQSEKFRSQTQILSVLSLPSIIDFSVLVEAPSYTGMDSFTENNLGDLSVPQGTRVSWQFVAHDSENLSLKFHNADTLLTAVAKKEKFSCQYQVDKSSYYSVLVSNQRFKARELVKYQLTVIPDQHPQIKVISMLDSIRPSANYFKGVIRDDYGFSGLWFKYAVNDGREQRIPISVNKNLEEQEFYFAFDFGNLETSEGATVHYYFEVKDNDAIQGPKSARTIGQSFVRPTSKQLYDMDEQIQDSLQNKMEESMSLSKALQKDILKLQENQIQNPGDEWQRQQLFQEIQNKRDRLEDLIDDIRQENLEKNQFMNSFEQEDAQLLEKQKQIEDLLAKVMDEELQKLLEEFNKLQQDFDAEKLNKLGEKLRMSFDDMNKQLDRNLELLKRYEMEGQFRKISDRLQKISKKQEQLSDSVKNEAADPSSKMEQQKNQLGEAEQDYQELLKQNQDLKQPFGMDEFSQDFQKIRDMMDQSQEMLQQKKARKASGNMKKTAQQLQKLSARMNLGLEESLQAQMSVDVDALIRLLNNLIQYSFDQEELIVELKEVDYRDPRFQEINQNQSVQKEKYKLIQDSLLQISARTPQLAVAMGQRVFDIENDLSEILGYFQERQKHRALVKQQEVMTQVNDLAVLLSEALRSLMEQMANAMPGDQMGEQKGPAVPSLAGLKQQQQSLKDQLQKMIQSMKEDGKQGQAQNQRLARMLRQQEMYRKSLDELMRKEGTGSKTGKILKDIMKMVEQTEREIANFSINSNTLIRQNRILTRLLEAENAEKQKDIDDKRESREGNSFKLSNPKELFEYKRVRINYNDNFYHSNVKLLDYYNKLYLDYMIKLNDD